MNVRELMTTELETATPDSSLEQLAAMMKESNVGSIPIVDEDGDLAGIVTDRDIVTRCIAEGKDAAETTAEEIMSEELETVEPDDDVDEAAEIMSRNQIRRLPVVEGGRLVGMLALGDIAVKARQDEVSGDTLEQVSKGVKGGRSGSASAKSGDRGAAQAKNVTGPAGAGDEDERSGRRGAMRSQQSVRNSEATGSMRASKTRGGRESQGITSHSPTEEDRRQERVVSIRPEARGAKRTRNKKVS